MPARLFVVPYCRSSRIEEYLCMWEDGEYGGRRVEPGNRSALVNSLAEGPQPRRMKGCRQSAVTRRGAATASRGPMPVPRLEASCRNQDGRTRCARIDNAGALGSHEPSHVGAVTRTSVYLRNEKLWISSLLNLWICCNCRTHATLPVRYPQISPHWVLVSVQ